MSMLRIGPEGLVLVYALTMSVVVAILSWYHVRLSRAWIVTLVVAVALATLQSFTLDPTDLLHRLVPASFIVVPSALLLALSRVNWLANRAWLLVLLGPMAFVGCYVGICELCSGLNFEATTVFLS
jgi:hypothetical protein